MTRVYIQVSTRDQNENHQLAALANLGIAELNLFWTCRAKCTWTIYTKLKKGFWLYCQNFLIYFFLVEKYVARGINK